MSDPPQNNFHLPTSAFRDHPDSVAELKRRVPHKKARARLRARLFVGDEPAHPPDRLTPKLESCPLPASWRLWDMFGGHQRDYRQLSIAERRVCAGARLLLPVTYRGLVRLDWNVARDDANGQPMTPAESGQPAWKFSKHSPRHVHAETVLDNHRVHIDWLSATKYGPGRSYNECRIFVDECLAGRGGECACSLGFGGTDLPAVAAVGMDAAITVDVISGEPVVEFWRASVRIGEPERSGEDPFEETSR